MPIDPETTKKVNEVGRLLRDLKVSRDTMVQIICYDDSLEIEDIVEMEIRYFHTQKGGSAVLRDIILSSYTFDVFVFLADDVGKTVVKCGGVCWYNPEEENKCISQTQ